MEYIFILGRTWELCQAELKTVLSREKINYQLVFSKNEIFHIKVFQPLDVNHLIFLLGGVIKITIFLTKLTKPINKSLIFDSAIENINNFKDFGLSFYTQAFSLQYLRDLSQEIKDILKKKGFKVNYSLPNKALFLSSVVVSKKKLLEINLVEEDEQFILSKTLAVFDFDNWNCRDYQRPFINPQKGMLPPKVARMMVNLSVEKSQSESLTLLDPFCGMGTILAEALTIGFNVYGSDIDMNSVVKTKKNLEWLISRFNLNKAKFEIANYDATHLSEKLKSESTNVIVTEPYLGPLLEINDNDNQTRTKNHKKITIEYLKNIITGLEKLYLGCLKDWLKVLKPGGRIVIILPTFKINDQGKFRYYSVEKTIDNCEKLGYNLINGPYKYYRPQTIVIRNIYVLKKAQN